METITEQDRVDTVVKLERAQHRFAPELELVELLERHRIVQTGNLGYYRSDVHCSCAAEWWAGDHAGDPSYEDMWNIHLAEVISGFLTDASARRVGSER